MSLKVIFLGHPVESWKEVSVNFQGSQIYKKYFFFIKILILIFFISYQSEILVVLRRGVLQYWMLLWLLILIIAKSTILYCKMGVRYNLMNLHNKLAFTQRRVISEEKFDHRQIITTFSYNLTFRKGIMWHYELQGLL